MCPSVPKSTLADTVLAGLTRVYPTAADPVRAVRVEAYLKGVAPALGMPTPERRALSRRVLAGSPPPDEADCAAIALRCWELPEREYHYFAADYLRLNAQRCSSAFLPVVRRLIIHKSWWDTVDVLAPYVAGVLVRADPGLAAAMDEWSTDESKWLVRAALLHQLRHRGATDTERLLGYCLRQAEHPDFFVRKAIGWSLREYAKTDPGAVRDFVAEHRDVLSPLSVREALKHL